MAVYQARKTFNLVEIIKLTCLCNIHVGGAIDKFAELLYY